MALNPDLDVDINLGGAMLRLSALTLAVESFPKENSSTGDTWAGSIVDRARTFETYLAGEQPAS